ncbi:dihydrofolate reductase [Nocardioides sp.]|uniref:dihydrofolate reductase n=1 Tax=Nocardioides sp. TaxID=35761 RepID=UPI002B270B1A|nr:dihydrofolate reductase [Nocardioides sp.]
MKVIAIAAVARNGVIGADGSIPWHLPDDFAHFKRTTLGHTLLMGRATYDSIGRPLPGRTTIVLTRDPAWSTGNPDDGVLVAHSVDDALALAARQDGDLYVAGGAVVYDALVPHLDEQVLSEVHLEPEGDTVYPIDPAAMSDWREASRESDDGFDVVRWVRVTPQG